MGFEQYGRRPSPWQQHEGGDEQDNGQPTQEEADEEHRLTSKDEEALVSQALAWIPAKPTSMGHHVVLTLQVIHPSILPDFGYMEPIMRL
jgi:hypothetical protein